MKFFLMLCGGSEDGPPKCPDGGAIAAQLLQRQAEPDLTSVARNDFFLVKFKKKLLLCTPILV